MTKFRTGPVAPRIRLRNVAGSWREGVHEMWMRYRRLGPRYEIWASVAAVLAASAATIGVCLWAIGQAP